MLGRIRARLRSDAVWQIIVTVVCVGLLARLGLFLYLMAYGGEAALFTGDGLRYLSLGDSTLRGQGYTYDGILDSFRAPGYPGYFMLFRILDLPLFLASIVQILFSAGIAGWAAWFAATRLQLSMRVSFLAGLLAALEPVQVYYGVMLLPDVFFTVGALAAFTYALRWFETGLLRYAAYAGIAIGIGNFFRPAMLYLPLFLAVAFLAYAWWNRRSLGRATVAAVLVAVVAFSVMSPWYARNQYTFGYFGFVSAKEYTLYAYVAAATKAAVEQKPYAAIRQEMLAQAKVEAPDPNRETFANSTYYRSMAYAVIVDHPKEFLSVYVLGLTAFWTSGNYQYILKSVGLLGRPSESISYSMLLASKGAYAAFSTFIGKMNEPFIAVALFDRVFGACVFILSIIGIVLHRRFSAAWLTGLFFLYFSATILSTVVGVEARHRYALNPLMFVFAIAAVSYAYHAFTRRFRV